METRTDAFVKTGLFTVVVIAIAALLIAVGVKAADRAAGEASFSRHLRHERMDFGASGAYHRLR